MLSPDSTKIADDRDRAVDRAADAAGETDDLARSIADRGDAMQRALDAGAIVVAEMTDALSDEPKVLASDVDLAEIDLFFLKSSFGRATKIQHDLDQSPAAFFALCHSQPLRKWAAATPRADPLDCQ